MKIKEIILEGFKSYGERTVISSLDYQFNAITGLNGSGKSNILEAICFVLGLQKWTLARVTNMRELIYKNGQAGIKQASVTIIFDNKDKGASPINLEALDEVRISRILKFDGSFYYLNGKKETNTNIKKIFKSIGLNIDNYNTFFVQQGRITSIVNFQPKELMNFLEETAGVSYYNVVKKDCITNLGKKDEKLNNANLLIVNDIEPELRNLEKGKEQLEKFNKIDTELEYVKKKLAFYKRKQGQEELLRLEKEIEKAGEELVVLKKKIASNNQKINKIDLVLKEFNNSDNKEASQRMSKGQEMKKIMDDLELEINRMRIIKRKLDDRVKRKEIDIVGCKAQKDKKSSELNAYTREIQFLTEEMSKNRVELDNIKAQEGSANIEKDYLTNKLKDLSKDAETQMSKRNIFIKKLRIFEREHSLMLDGKKEAGNQHNKLVDRLKDLEREVKELKEEFNIREKELINVTDYDYQLEIVNNEIKMRLNARKDILGQHCNHFEIKYADDISKYLAPGAVKGKVHSLLKVKDPVKFVNALEAIAGGKLFYIIVDNEQTCQIILNKRLIYGKIDMVPINRIRPWVISLDKRVKAQQLARDHDGEVWNPMELIEYPQDLKLAFDFVFGAALIASNSEVAGIIAYNSGLQIKCVTLDGDVYDPSGTLDGGYRDSSNSILFKSNEIKEICAEIDRLTKKATELRNQRNANKEKITRVENLKSQINVKEKEASSIDKRIGALNITIIDKKEALLAEEIAFTKNEIETTERRLIKINEDTNEVTNHMQTNTKSSDTFIHDNIVKMEKDNKKMSAELKSKMELCEEIKLTLICLEEDYKDNVEISEKLRLEKNELETEIESSIKKKVGLDEGYKKIVLEIEADNRQRVMILNQKNQLDNDRLMIEQENTDFISKKDQRSNDLGKLQEYFLKLKNNLKKQNVKGMDPSIKDLDIPIDQIVREIDILETGKTTLEAEYDKLHRHVRKNVEIEFDNANKRYNQIIDRRTEINNNKETIKSNIFNLDSKKDDAVRNCFNIVNKNLGTIFSNLLPGAFAAMNLVDLNKPKDKELQKGIEIRISFNGKWKESLSELSGGQRSLLALAFLLALLSYNPAPFYIFDEVDAALDLSHTENLGVLISKHFPQSQFIVISLKEEFFSNANVLYKTYLEDGHSKIERYYKNK